MNSNQKTRLIIAFRDFKRVESEDGATEEQRRRCAAVLACEQRLARRRIFYGQMLSELMEKGELGKAC